MTVLERNNVKLGGLPDGPPMVFVHGFGCDQSMWREVTPAFAATRRIVTYDLTGMGGSALAAYDPRRHADLQAHADELIEILDALSLGEVCLVGHSIGATIALLAANRAPDRVSRLVMVSPSPAFLEDAEAGYRGGFAREEIEGLVALLDENHLGWSMQMAPTIAGQPAEDPSAVELTQSFCRTDPQIMSHFGRVTFFADRRADFEKAARPALVLHCDKDALVPMAVADWMRDRMPGATVEVLDATGHCPHMTVPETVVAAMGAHLGPA
ncbi:alpha/beta fold hydrolase [Limimaricola cinnabarinus]|uniref:alpha/beta fold hydrolase n=1 Tax=Limimaricola cinnabarinus TaxID=1125964 RepID=UPI002FDFBDCF